MIRYMLENITLTFVKVVGQGRGKSRDGMDTEVVVWAKK